MNENMRFQCQECSKEIKIDLIFPDELWKEITPDGFKILCASCIMNRLERNKSQYVYKLLQIWRPGIKWNPEDDYKDTGLRQCSSNHKLIYFEGQICPMCKFQEGYNELRDMYFEQYTNWKTLEEDEVMNRKIQRYSIKHFGWNHTDLPSNAFFLDIYSVEGTVYITFLIDVDALKHKRTFYLASASEILSDECEFEYKGSTLVTGIPVFLFEKIIRR